MNLSELVTLISKTSKTIVIKLTCACTRVWNCVSAISSFANSIAVPIWANRAVVPMLCTFCVACWRSPRLFLVFVASLWSPVFWWFIRVQCWKPFVPTANAFGVPLVLFERDLMFTSRHGWQKMTSLSVSYRSQLNSCSHLSWKTRLLFFSGVVLQSSSESLSSSGFRF